MMKYSGTTYGVSSGPTLTEAGLLENIRRVKRELAYEAVRDAIDLDSIATSDFAIQRVPVKLHKKRRHQKEAYHKRIQKKWNKRYGTKEQPALYVVDTGALGWFGGGRRIIAHPAIARELISCQQKSPSL